MKLLGTAERGDGVGRSIRTGIYSNYPQESSEKNWSLHREEKKTTTQNCRTGEILTAKKWYCSGEFSRKNKTPFNNWPAGMSYRGIN